MFIHELTATSISPLTAIYTMTHRGERTLKYSQTLLTIQPECIYSPKARVHLFNNFHKYARRIIVWGPLYKK